MDHISLVLLEFGGLILGLALVGGLAARVGISPIPLYLLAGLGLGDGGVLPLSASQEIVEFGAELGVVLLLLMLGLEYNAGELVSGLRRAAPVGLLDGLLNAIPGVLAALLLGWGPVGALVLGGVTYMTSSAITAKLLGDLGWLGNREVPGVLSVLVIEDLAMAVYLPLLTTVLAAAGLASGAISLGVAIVAVVAVLIVALRFGGVVERFVSSPNDEVLLLKVLGLAMVVAGLAGMLQVSAAVGAFLVGIALSGPLAHLARERLEPLRDLFAAVFFVFFGLQTDPSQLPPVVGVAFLLAIAGLAGKLLTGYMTARRSGVGRNGRIRAGVVLTPRGEFSIVIAGLATSAGVDFPVATLAAAYVLILAVAGPLVARLADHFLVPSKRRRTAASSRRSPSSSSSSSPTS